jgi:hypothetical protein
MESNLRTDSAFSAFKDMGDEAGTLRFFRRKRSGAGGFFTVYDTFGVDAETIARGTLHQRFMLL